MWARCVSAGMQLSGRRTAPAPASSRRRRSAPHRRERSYLCLYASAVLRSLPWRAAVFPALECLLGSVSQQAPRAAPARLGAAHRTAQPLRHQRRSSISGECVAAGSHSAPSGAERGRARAQLQPAVSQLWAAAPWGRRPAAQRRARAARPGAEPWAGRAGAVQRGAAQPAAAGPRQRAAPRRAWASRGQAGGGALPVGAASVATGRRAAAVARRGADRSGRAPCKAGAPLVWRWGAGRPTVSRRPSRRGCATPRRWAHQGRAARRRRGLQWERGCGRRRRGRCT